MKKIFLVLSFSICISFLSKASIFLKVLNQTTAFKTEDDKKNKNNRRIKNRRKVDKQIGKNEKYFNKNDNYSFNNPRNLYRYQRYSDPNERYSIKDKRSSCRKVIATKKTSCYIRNKYKNNEALK